MNKWNNEELKTEKLRSDKILGYNGSIYLTLNAANNRYSTSLYDYTPDIENGIDIIFTVN